jgi:hypothetical protein
VNESISHTVPAGPTDQTTPGESSPVHKRVLDTKQCRWQDWALANALGVDWCNTEEKGTPLPKDGWNVQILLVKQNIMQDVQNTSILFTSNRWPTEALSESDSPRRAVDRLCRRITQQVGGKVPSVEFLHRDRDEKGEKGTTFAFWGWDRNSPTSTLRERNHFRIPVGKLSRKAKWVRLLDLAHATTPRFQRECFTRLVARLRGNERIGLDHIHMGWSVWNKARLNLGEVFKHP